MTSWSFQKKARLGYIASVVAASVIGVASVIILRSTIRSNDNLILGPSRQMVDIESLRADSEKMASAGRGYLITGDRRFLENMRQARAQLEASLSDLRRGIDGGSPKRLLAAVEADEQSFSGLQDKITLARREPKDLDGISRTFETDLQPLRERLEGDLGRLKAFEAKNLEVALRHSRRDSRQAMALLIVVIVLSIGLALGLFYFVSRTLIRLYATMERARQLREEVLSVVSHDLKAPLSVILLNEGLMRRMLSLPENRERIERSLEKIRRAGDRMNHMIRDLLDLARIEEDQVTLSLQEREAAALVRAASELMGPLAAEKNVTLHWRASAPEAWVLCDAERITQVLENLIGNAIKFNPEGGSIEMGSERQDGWVLFWVKDQGPGIPSDRQAAIFDRFQQVNSEDRKHGSGLGLAIARGFVEAHGGQIGVESAPGLGSRFFFRLPSASGATRAEPPKRAWA